MFEDLSNKLRRINRRLKAMMSLPHALGLYGLPESPKPTVDQLVKKRREIMVKHHSDKGGDPEKAKDFGEAFETIKDWIEKGRIPPEFKKPPQPPPPQQKFYFANGTAYVGPQVKVREDGTAVVLKVDRCPKCGGTGRYGRFGTCFNCNGRGNTGSRSETIYNEEAFAKLKDKADKEKQEGENRKKTERQAVEEFEKKHAELFQEARKMTRHTWVVNLLHRMDNGNQIPTDNEMGQLRQYVEKNKEQRGNKSHLGEVGKKITAKVTVDGLRDYPGQYGTTWLVKMHDENNNILVWWATNPPKDLQAGAKVTITGTVKEHKDFNGVPQTVLTRCKVSTASGSTKLIKLAESLEIIFEHFSI